MSMSSSGKRETIRKLVKQNDTKTRFYFYIKNMSDSADINLTSCTLKFQMKLFGGTSLQVDDAMMIINAATGYVYYQFSGEDLNTPGTYDAEIEITFPTTEKLRTSDRLIITVLPEVAV